MRSETVPLATAMPCAQPCAAGEPALELGDLLPVQAAPRAAAQRAEQPRLLGLTEDRPRRERAGAHGRATEKGECVGHGQGCGAKRSGTRLSGSRVMRLAM